MLVCGIFAKLSIQPPAHSAGGAYRKVLCSKTDLGFTSEFSAPRKVGRTLENGAALRFREHGKITYKLGYTYTLSYSRGHGKLTYRYRLTLYRVQPRLHVEV